MDFNHLPSTIIYVRHPECLHNVDPSSANGQGIPNRLSPLTTTGEQQARITSEYVAQNLAPFDVIFASEYSRTHAIPMRLSVPFVVDSRLNERNLGVWHELSKQDVLAKYPGEDNNFERDGYLFYTPPEGGENVYDVIARLESFLVGHQDLKNRNKVCISGHGIAGLCLLAILTRKTAQELVDHERMKNASIAVFKKNGNSYEVSSYNIIPWKGELSESKGIKEA